MSSTEDEDSSGKLTMLCLHGFLQSAAVFRSKVGSMRKGLKSRVHFVFQDAPFHAASTLTEEQVARFGGSQDGLTWFQWQDLGPDKRPSLAVKYAQWDVTYAALCDALRSHKPDGLFGFSQGATATALFLASLLTAQQQGRDLDVPLPRFCVVCAGFLPNDPQYADLLKEARVDVPALFISGAADALIPPHRSKELMDTFDPTAVTLLEHPGAHFVPTCSGEYKQQLVAFLDRFKSDSSTAAAAKAASASVGSNLGSVSEADEQQQQPDNEAAEDAEVPSGGRL